VAQVKWHCHRRNGNELDSHSCPHTPQVKWQYEKQPGGGGERKRRRDNGGGKTWTPQHATKKDKPIGAMAAYEVILSFRLAKHFFFRNVIAGLQKWNKAIQTILMNSIHKFPFL